MYLYGRSIVSEVILLEKSPAYTFKNEGPGVNDFINIYIYYLSQVHCFHIVVC